MTPKYPTSVATTPRVYSKAVQARRVCPTLVPARFRLYSPPEERSAKTQFDSCRSRCWAVGAMGARLSRLSVISKIRVCALSPCVLYGSRGAWSISIYVGSTVLLYTYFLLMFRSSSVRRSDGNNHRDTDFANLQFGLLAKPI